LLGAGLRAWLGRAAAGGRARLRRRGCLSGEVVALLDSRTGQRAMGRAEEVRSYLISPELHGFEDSLARVHGIDGVQRDTGAPRTAARRL
jgi:hypothetical protein